MLYSVAFIFGYGSAKSSEIDPDLTELHSTIDCLFYVSQPKHTV